MIFGNWVGAGPLMGRADFSKAMSQATFCDLNQS